MDEVSWAVDPRTEDHLGAADVSSLTAIHPGGQDPVVCDASVRKAAVANQDFGDFYAGHFSDLVRLATLLSGSADSAPDLVQDCFVGLHKRWTSVHDPLPYVRRS